MNLKDLIVYHIFIDRFYGFDYGRDDAKPQRIGGNLRGVIKKLSYIKKLGANCIWLSPFYKSTSYHGYDVEDFFKVDENVGNEEDLKTLIKESHRMGLKVIADFVPNHCSEKHPFFLDAINNEKSKYTNWFYFKRWPYDYLSFLHFKNLPKINLANKEALQYMLKAASYWFDIGIDGFRVDHAIGPEKQFSKELQMLANKRKKFLLGEVWFFGVKQEHAETIKGVDLKKVFEAKDYVSLEDAAINELDVFDSFLDFTFNRLLKDYLKGKLSSKEFYLIVEKHYRQVKPVMFTFLDNHDMNRLIFELNNDKELFKIASALQFVTSQPPIIYYGDEVGLSQAMSIEELPEHGDVQARRRMEWVEQDEGLFKHYQRLCMLRKKLTSMRYGEMKALYYEDNSRLLALLKESEDNRLLAIFNPDDTNVVFNLQLQEINANRMIDVFNKEEIGEKSIRMELQPKSFKIFLLR
ncbi:MAG: alpha-amylase family glycosyl hydrolase [Candidatus Aenigmarchaeota archaeon]|nr:alpha-amylase family glycosyl hydrolase [Candidatus Aenigmarchaeota archaeon]